MTPRQVAHVAAAGRMIAGLAFAGSPREVGGVLVGPDAGTPGGRLFVSAFGARDVLLGAGALSALTRGRPARRWIASCAAADAFDAAVTLRGWSDLPRGRRALTFAVSAAPALLGCWLATTLDE